MAPRLVIFNHDLARSLGLDFDACDEDALAALFAGNTLVPGMAPIAQAYAGHQFGHFTLLGDGRAILLGEQLTPGGGRFDIQLKGSGRTPYSRRGDGRAALGPMLREYIISEALFALGVPTTRSLAVVATGETVLRQTPLPGAVLTRVAASHLRVGTFEYVARLPDPESLRALADYALRRHFPERVSADRPYLALLQAVIERQASLVAKWMQIGFVHGVMNTDNMAISGETIDYGPCAFIDAYDPSIVFSSIDHQGRYAYARQPRIAQWNLARFAETLLPLLDADTGKAIAAAEKEIGKFTTLYQDRWLAGMRAKLGLLNEEADDASLIDELLGWMARSRADFTGTFRKLSEDALFAEDAAFGAWHARWRSRRDRQPHAADAARRIIQSSNPAVIPRNHRVEAALTAAEAGDDAPLRALLDALRDPYASRSDRQAYIDPPPASDGCYQTFCGT